MSTSKVLFSSKLNIFLANVLKNDKLEKFREVEVTIIRGGANRGVWCGCVGGNTPPPTRQPIGKLLSQSAKLDWLKITTEETKIDFLNN
jgi:hypothetical protein